MKDKWVYFIFSALAAIMLGVNYIPNDEKVITGDLKYVTIKPPDDRALYAARLRNSLSIDDNNTEDLKAEALSVDTSIDTYVSTAYFSTLAEPAIPLVGEIPWFFTFERKSVLGEDDSPTSKTEIFTKAMSEFYSNSLEGYRYVFIDGEGLPTPNSGGGLFADEVEDVYFIVPKETKIIAPTNFVITNWTSMKDGSAYPAGDKASKGISVEGYSLIRKNSGTYLYRLEFRSLDRAWFHKDKSPGRDSKTAYANYVNPPTNFSIPSKTVIGWAGVSSVPSGGESTNSTLVGWKWGDSQEGIDFDDLAVVQVYVEKSKALSPEEVNSFNQHLASFSTAMTKSNILEYYTQN